MINIIKRALVDCSCGTSIRYDQMKDHISEKHPQILECPIEGCKIMVEMENRENHWGDCQYRLSLCQYCGTCIKRD